MHGRHGGSDQGQSPGAPVADYRSLASYANTPNNDNAIGPHGITVLGKDHVFVTNGGPTEPKDPMGATISRDALAAENPVADLFGRLLLIPRPGRS